MKKIFNYKLFLTLFILISILNFGQKTEFTVPKNIEELQNTIFDFKNDFTRDEAKAAAAGDNEFSTTVDLYDLKFDANEKNPYLNLAVKNGAKPKQFIQKAIWNVSMKKVSAKSTKISVFLEEVNPDSWSKKEVDVKLTKSTGKLEKEIKEFLLNSKIKQTSKEVTDTNTEAEIEVTTEAQIAGFEAQKSKKKVASKYLQNLFAKKQFISLPTSAEQLTKLLKTDPSEMECETCKNGKYSNWDFENFNMIYANMTSGEEYYAIQYYGEDAVSGLPYGLVFNDSSPSECKDKFARYKAQLYQTTVGVDENTSKALTVVTFKMNTSFVRLEFGNEYLTRIVISNKEF
jgi:phenylpyruvate tautomerase PptA (4-oxalocrotonate tautomerase family)